MTNTLEKDSSAHKTPYNSFKRLPQKATVTHFKELVAHHDWLMDFGDFTKYLTGISKIKLEQFAEEARALNAASLKEMRDKNKQLSLIACLLSQAQCRAKDALGLTFCCCIHNSDKDALRYYMSLDKNKDETIESIAALLLKLTTGYQNKHANKAKLVKLLTQHYEQYGGTSKVIDDCNKLLAKNNNKYFPHIWKHYYSKRTGIFSFLESVHLDCIKQDKPLLQAVKLVVKFRKSKQNKEWIELGKEIDLSFVPKDWKKLIAKKDNKTINTRYFEVCVMMQLREKLSTSDIYIKGADAYGDYRKTFMPWSECATLLKEFCDASEIPNTAKKMVSFLKKELKTKAKSVDKAYPNLNELVIGDNGIPVLKKRQATKNPRAKSLREEIKSRMPERNLLDIMCLAQNCTDWAYCLSPLSGSSAKLSDLNSSHKCITH